MKRFILTVSSSSSPPPLPSVDGVAVSPWITSFQFGLQVLLGVFCHSRPGKVHGVQGND